MIIPNWQPPQNINAFTLTHEDEPLNLPAQLLQQVHGKEVVVLPTEQALIGDAVLTREPNTCCAVKTADCLPILVTNKSGAEVAAIHAGWKGLVAGIIEATFQKMHSMASECMVWVGPAICGKCFEVGPEVKEAFESKNPQFASAFITAQNPGKFIGNLPKIAELILQGLGVKEISQSGICTMEDLRCDSYRREKGTQQRMVSVIKFK